MDKIELKKELKNLKNKQKEEKIRYKLQRPPFKTRFNNKVKTPVYGFIFDRYTSVHNFVNKRKMIVDELKVKVDYIVDSLKATANTTDEIRKKTIEDIVENIDNL